MKPFSRCGLRFLLSKRKAIFAASYTVSIIHLSAFSSILMKQLKNLLLRENMLCSIFDKIVQTKYSFFHKIDVEKDNNKKEKGWKKWNGKVK